MGKGGRVGRVPTALLVGFCTVCLGFLWMLFGGGIEQLEAYTDRPLHTLHQFHLSRPMVRFTLKPVAMVLPLINAGEWTEQVPDLPDAAHRSCAGQPCLG